MDETDKPEVLPIFSPSTLIETNQLTRFEGVRCTNGYFIRKLDVCAHPQIMKNKFEFFSDLQLKNVRNPSDLRLWGSRTVWIQSFNSGRRCWRWSKNGNRGGRSATKKAIWCGFFEDNWRNRKMLDVPSKKVKFYQKMKKLCWQKFLLQQSWNLRFSKKGDLRWDNIPSMWNRKQVQLRTGFFSSWKRWRMQHLRRWFEGWRTMYLLQPSSRLSRAYFVRSASREREQKEKEEKLSIRSGIYTCIRILCISFRIVRLCPMCAFKFRNQFKNEKKNTLLLFHCIPATVHLYCLSTLETPIYIGRFRGRINYFFLHHWKIRLKWIQTHE